MQPKLNFPDKAAKKLLRREEVGSFRTLPNNLETAIDFFSNDYLGLARNEELAEQIRTRYESYRSSIRNGATGSRLLSGNSSRALELEEYLAKYFQAEAALIFNSGFSANIGLLSCLPQKGDTILYDELAHASLKQGARLSHAQRYSFRHNDLEDLERKIRRSEGDIFVVAESIYSMDGDHCPLFEMVDLCKKYGVLLILDEAHSTGIFGENGEGIACNLEPEQEIFARIYTFGKAVGVHGACVVGDQKLKEYLINFSSPFIYTTAMPPHALFSIEAALGFIEKKPMLRENLFNNIAYFDRLFGPAVSVSTPIKSVQISGNNPVKRAAYTLQEAGFAVMPVLSPTVAEGKERLRICIHAHNTEEEIEQLCFELSSLLRQ